MTMPAKDSFENKHCQRVIKSVLANISVFPVDVALNILGRCAGHLLADIHKTYGTSAYMEAQEHFQESVSQGKTDEWVWRMKQQDGLSEIIETKQ